MTGTESEPTEDCPVCGQPYQHYREDVPGAHRNLRKDATECRQVIGEDRFNSVRKTYEVYVHVE